MMAIDNDESVAAGLFEEYVAALQAGDSCETEALLQRCPDSEKEGLRLAIKGTDFLVNNWVGMLVPERVVAAAVNRIRQLRAESPWRCEGCHQLLLAEEVTWRDEDGICLCAKCAPTPSTEEE